MRTPAIASGQLKLRTYRFAPVPSARTAMLSGSYAGEGELLLVDDAFLRRLRLRTGGFASFRAGGATEATGSAGGGSATASGRSLCAPFPFGRFTDRIGM